ncbi:substrate-binding domain-containing protein [Treponema zioleckii]|uniref:substrate-binding domain-containing protein n=1 Tax=Treponema zioleckii TaxID=331680 RepID=UPI00168B5307|nr:substrate-binding domain-containing protein [Treponema zioleckii]
MDHNIEKRKIFLRERRRTGNRVTIGFAGIADFRSFIGQKYIAGMIEAAVDYDINFINMAGAIKYSLFDDINFMNHYMKNFKFMKSPLVDGLVTWASSLCEFLKDDEVVSLFSKLQPLPMVDIGYLDIPGVPSIRIDNDSSILRMMRHLIEEHGYKKFAFIGSKSSLPHLRRLAAFRKALSKYNISEIEDAVYLSDSMESVDIGKIVKKLSTAFDLHEKKELEAIVTSSDVVAATVIDELDKLGISVPADIAVTGFNNQYDGISALSPVTSIDLEYFKRGYAAVELLIDRIMRPDLNFRKFEIPTKIIVRQSCGCFEESISQISEVHKIQNNEELVDLSQSQESELDIRKKIFLKIKSIFVQESDESIKSLVDAFFTDFFIANDSKKMLVWFRNFIQKERKQKKIDNNMIQQRITKLRTTLLPLVQENVELTQKLETVLHQMRTLISVFIDYDLLTNGDRPYMVNSISKIAISFAAATSKKQIFEALKFHLLDLEIPGVILALENTMTLDLAQSAVELIVPEPDEIMRVAIPKFIQSPELFPKKIFPRNRRYSMMLEVLFHENHYFGYAFLEMGTQNIAIYDTVRLLLSNALYPIFLKKESDVRSRAFEAQYAGILPIAQSDGTNAIIFREGITAKRIIDYLLEHIGEMSDLDKMATDMGVSKSYLMRRTKLLTSYTIQELHEKLRIEQAKNLLLLQGLSLGEVSERLGFKSQNYFSTVFKKNTGLPPATWVKRNKG